MGDPYKIDEQIKEYIRYSHKGVYTQRQLLKFYASNINDNFGIGILNLLEKTINLTPNSRILDIGCGFGTFVRVCRKRGFLSFGIDINEDKVRLADKKTKNWNNNFSFAVASAEKMPFRNGTFDLVVIYEVLEHIKNQEMAFNEAYRLLKKGGFLYLVTTNYLVTFNEPHYHVPWLPLLNKRAAECYLGVLHRNKYFLRNQIFYTTYGSVISMFRNKKMKILFPKLVKINHPEYIKSSLARQLVSLAKKTKTDFLFKLFLNSPLQPVIDIIGHKV